MKNTVILKNIDDLGRIVLPKDIRKKLGMEIRSSVVYVLKMKNNYHESSGFVYFCHSKLNLTDFKGKKICQNCLSEIK